MGTHNGNVAATQAAKAMGHTVLCICQNLNLNLLTASLYLYSQTKRLIINKKCECGRPGKGKKYHL